jgi:hypothetical protein
MGYTPAAIISAVDETKLGKTSPGQSQSIISERSGRRRVWKCFVLPGWAATPTRTTPWMALELPTSTFMTDDLPTEKK